MGKRSKDRTIWLNHFWAPLDVGFVPSKAAWDRELKSRGRDDAYPAFPACVSSFITVSGAPIVLVTVAHRPTRDRVLSHLAHEAVHVAQHTFKAMHEPAPGEECSAYVIGHWFDELLCAYDRSCRK